jgi:hypothetical protein
MTPFTYTCVTLADVCEINNLDYETVMDRLNNSDVSFGTNDDTLITRQTLESVLDLRINFSDLSDDVMISLGS